MVKMDITKYNNRVEYTNDKGQLQYITGPISVYNNSQWWLNDQESAIDEFNTKQESE